MREGFAHFRFRRSVLADPVLATTLDRIIASTEGLEGFLAQCEGVPGCGDVQIDTIRAALLTEIRQQAAMAALAGDEVLAERLLALTRLRDPSADRPLDDVTAQMHFDDTAGLEDICLRIWRQASPARFHYMPATLPECAKSAAVIAAERGVKPASSPAAAWPEPCEPPPELAPAKTGLILVDTQALEAIRGRVGRYTVLSEREMTEQMAMLSEFCAKLPPGIEALVTDFERARLSSGAILGQRVVLSGPGGHAVFMSPPGLSQMVARCEAARKDADPLAAHLGATAQPYGA